VARFLAQSETGFIADEACFISAKIGGAAEEIIIVFTCPLQAGLRKSAFICGQKK